MSLENLLNDTESVLVKKGRALAGASSLFSILDFSSVACSSGIPSGQPGSLRMRQGHPAQQVGIAWVGADGIPRRIYFDGFVRFT
jgi:hypothetical protein